MAVQLPTERCVCELRWTENNNPIENLALAMRMSIAAVERCCSGGSQNLHTVRLDARASTLLRFAVPQLIDQARELRDLAHFHADPVRVAGLDATDASGSDVPDLAWTLRVLREVLS